MHSSQGGKRQLTVNDDDNDDDVVVVDMALTSWLLALGFHRPQTGARIPIPGKEGFGAQKPWSPACVKAKGNEFFSTLKPSLPENGDSGHCLGVGGIPMLAKKLC